ncbi:MAG: response regulator [Tepidisphaeraceae bacterium]|jgi:putative two-component system response regulator
MHALIVDDDELSLDILQGVLEEMGHQVLRAHDGQEALQIIQERQIHLVITDWEMPKMNGLELCRAIRQGDFDGYVYIVMLTSRDGGQQKIEGLHAGADAFLVKPLNSDELLVSLKTADRILALETRELAMFALAKLSESRDPETGAHLERVQSYARLLAQYLSTTEKFFGRIDHEFIRLIYQTTPLHDIGKVGIPDNVLLKPGKLSDEETSIMRTHAKLGAQTLEASLQRFPNVRFLQMARDIALFHHERWDGQGYPNGLAGEQIPLPARIVALADVYDALTSRRVYRHAMSHPQAKAIIDGDCGTHFDPDIVDAFHKLEKQFITIREQYRDAESEQEAMAPQPEQNSTPKISVVRPPETLRIMVVDDDPVARDIIANYLHSQGIDCSCHAGAADALAQMDRVKPRIVISDWQMPEMDGLEFCRRVRVTEGHRHVHFIMLTIHASKEDLARAFDAGVDDFVAKPFSEVDLMSRLRSGQRVIDLYDELNRQHQGSRQLNVQLMNINRRLETLAITDDLTGLYNRRQAMSRLEEQWTLSDRYHWPVSVVSLDIDHFKRINDAHGHAAGDAVLLEVAGILRGCVRSTDTVCRIGGEEFLIILPFQTMPEAELSAQRCRLAVAAKEFKFDGHMIRSTISAGIAARRSDMVCCADLLAEADEALYAAKHAGRNRIQLARNPAALESAGRTE